MTEELKQAISALQCAKRGHCDHAMADEAISALEALTQRPAAQTEREAPYGYCPECGAPGVTRERRPDGDDKCSNGHRYPSRSAHASLPTQPAAQEMPDAVEHYGTVDDLPAAQATPEPDDAQRRFEAGCVVLEYLRDIGAPYRAVHHMLIALHGDPEAKSKATPEPVQPRTFDARNAQFREHNWQIRFDAAVDARRLAQERLYSERERHTAEVKRLQLEIGRLTATPERSDGTALGDVFQEMVIGSTVRELTDLGFLVECDVKAASLGKSLAQDPVKAWLEHSGGRPGFVFAKSVAHSRDIVAGLVAAGVLAVHVDGTTAKGIRDRAVEDFRRGRIDVLCSMGVFTEGTDLPRATVCLLARAFTHASLYLQCIGRVLRPSPGKGRALIIDLIGSVHEHGLPDDERIWSLDGEPHRLADSAQAVKQCDVCGCAYRPGPPACPMCGAKAEPEAPPKIEERPLDDLGRRMAPLMPGASQEQKDRKWRELVDKGRESGYNPKWASVRYHAIFGQWRNR